VQPDREPRLVLDWDGTVTVVDTLWLVLAEFGDAEVFRRVGEQLLAGRIGYRELMELEFATVRHVELPRVTAWLADNAAVRPGFHELVRRYDPLVLSSGFEELIRPLLAREGVEVELVANRIDPRPGGWRVVWNRDEPCDVCGDSLSAERIFARAGLAEFLDAQGVAYEPFEDLDDVRRALER